LIKEHNTENNGSKQLVIGIDQTENHKFKRMMKFLIEAGLLFELKSVKHGDNRTYLRYIPHLLFLIQNRTFSDSKGFKAQSIVERLEAPNEKHPIRRTISTILGKEKLDALRLDSPPCQKCDIQRINEEQRYCHNCGAKLVEASIYETCMQIKIENLPISQYQKQRLLEDTDIRVIGDYFTSSSPSTELRQARQIGAKRAPKIYEATERFIEEYL